MMRFSLTAATAVAALTFGIAGPEIAPMEVDRPSADGYRVIAAETETATEDETGSAKMGEETGTHSGAEADTPESDTKKIDQPAREDEEPVSGSDTAE